MTKALKQKRKAPTQKRALVTYDAILQATAQVLSEEGIEHFTTNRIAVVAGVSVGTLYQYFNDKSDLLHAITLRHTEKLLGLLEGEFAHMPDATPEELVSGFVKAMLAAHYHEPELHRAVVVHLLTHDLSHIESTTQRARDVVRALLQEHKARLVPKDLDLAAYVVVTTVQSLVNGAIFAPGVFDPDVLHQEICDVVFRYLLCDGPASA